MSIDVDKLLKKYPSFNENGGLGIQYVKEAIKQSKMITDTAQIEESLKRIVDYNWEDEMVHFEETFDVEIQSQDNIEPWIEWCKEAGPYILNEVYPVDHIFYHLMVIKAANPELWEQ
jgi:hypothetical protein